MSKCPSANPHSFDRILSKPTMFLHDQCQERQRGSTNSSRSHTAPPATTTPAHRMLTPGPSGRNSPAAAMASPERRRTLARITERVRRIAGANTKRRREQPLHGLLGWMASFMESRSLAWHPRNLEPYSSYKLGSTGVGSGFPDHTPEASDWPLAPSPHSAGNEFEGSNRRTGPRRTKVRIYL
jgi:hypothetical protein